MLGKIRHYASAAWKETKLIHLKSSLETTAGHNLFVFGAPFHSNLGDQAQSYCIEQWAKKNYPDYNIWIFDTMFVSFNDYQLLNVIRKLIRLSDKIFLHSGYHTTDLYMLEENMQRKVVQLFPDMRIVILPQTIYYKNHEQLEKAKSIYNAHPDLHLLCRDDVSFATAQKEFANCKLMKFPDIVTSMIGSKHYENPRKGIFLCMRNDKEAFYSKERIEQLRQELSDIDDVTLGDTTISMPAKEIIANRAKVLNDTWNQYSQYRVIITDRYHGTIFSLIAGTPVLVLSSSDHKLSSGVKWFPEEFSDYVHYVPDINTVREQVERVYAADLDYRLPPYFQEKYYSKLKGLIGD